MEKITKKDFMAMHKTGKLGLIQGLVKKSKDDIFNILDGRSDIQEWAKPVSNFGDLSSDKNGAKTTTIFKKGRFIFVEDIIDNSKNPDCSWNDLEVYNTIYFLTE